MTDDLKQRGGSGSGNFGHGGRPGEIGGSSGEGSGGSGPRGENIKNILPGSKVIHESWDPRTSEPMTVKKTKDGIFLTLPGEEDTEFNAGGEGKDGWIVVDDKSTESEDYVDPGGQDLRPYKERVSEAVKDIDVTMHSTGGDRKVEAGTVILEINQKQWNDIQKGSVSAFMDAFNKKTIFTTGGDKTNVPAGISMSKTDWDKLAKATNYNSDLSTFKSQRESRGGSGSGNFGHGGRPGEIGGSSGGSGGVNSAWEKQKELYKTLPERENSGDFDSSSKYKENYENMLEDANTTKSKIIDVNVHSDGSVTAEIPNNPKEYLLERRKLEEYFGNLGFKVEGEQGLGVHYIHLTPPPGVFKNRYDYDTDKKIT